MDLWQVTKLFVCLLSYTLLRVLFPCLVWDAWWPLSVFNLSITPCKCASVSGSADICSCVTSLCLRPVMSGWFIQRQLQLQWTSLAHNDLSCHWKKSERKVRGRRRRRRRWGRKSEERDDTKSIWMSERDSKFFHLRQLDWRFPRCLCHPASTSPAVAREKNMRNYKEEQQLQHIYICKRKEMQTLFIMQMKSRNELTLKKQKLNKHKQNPELLMDTIN